MRRSKFDELWQAARDWTEQHPGQPFKLMTYSERAQADAVAEAVNNGHHRYFLDDHSRFRAAVVPTADGHQLTLTATDLDA